MVLPTKILDNADMRSSIAAAQWKVDITDFGSLAGVGFLVVSVSGTINTSEE